MFERHKKGLYRVQHTGSHVKRLATKVDEFYKNKLEQAKMLSDDVGEAICNDFKSACYMSSYTISSKMMKESPAYFQGLKFVIDTGGVSIVDPMTSSLRKLTNVRYGDKH